MPNRSDIPPVEVLSSSRESRFHAKSLRHSTFVMLSSISVFASFIERGLVNYVRRSCLMWEDCRRQKSRHGGGSLHRRDVARCIQSDMHRGGGTSMLHDSEVFISGIQFAGLGAPGRNLPPPGPHAAGRGIKFYISDRIKWIRICSARNAQVLDFPVLERGCA